MSLTGMCQPMNLMKPSVVKLAHGQQQVTLNSTSLEATLSLYAKMLGGLVLKPKLTGLSGLKIKTIVAAGPPHTG